MTDTTSSTPHTPSPTTYHRHDHSPPPSTVDTTTSKGTDAPADPDKGELSSPDSNESPDNQSRTDTRYRDDDDSTQAQLYEEKQPAQRLQERGGGVPNIIKAYQSQSEFA